LVDEDADDPDRLFSSTPQHGHPTVKERCVMSTSTGTLSHERRGTQPRRLVAAIVASIAIGAGIGAVITNAVVDGSTTPASQVVLSPGAWDPQKLDAMGKRQEAELVIREATGQG
jgi:hypothetical protein